MNARTEVLLRFYEEHAAQSRQHESQRERLTNLFLIASAAGFGLIVQYREDRAALVIAIFILVFSVLIFVLSLKHYERNRLHVTLMEQAQKAIDSELDIAPDPHLNQMSLSDLRKKGRRKHYETHRIWKAPERPEGEAVSWLCRWRLHWIWSAIPLVLGFFAVFSLILSLERGVRLW